MKKFIFGCILMVSGILGGTGWVLARAIMASPHGWASLSHLFSFSSDWWTERFFIIAFYTIAIIGAVIVLKTLKEDT